MINGHTLSRSHREALRVGLRYFTTELATVFFDRLSEEGKDFIQKINDILWVLGEVPAIDRTRTQPKKKDKTDKFKDVT